MVTVHSRIAHLLCDYDPKHYRREGFCPSPQAIFVGKTRYYHSLRGCE